MAKLPSAQDIQRSTPSFQRPAASVNLTAPYQAMERAGEQVSSMAFAQIEAENKKREQTNWALASADYTRKQIELENELKSSTDYVNMPRIYQERMKQIEAESASMIQDSSSRELFLAQRQANTAQGFGKVSGWARDIYSQQSVANTMSLLDANSISVGRTSDPIHQSELIRDGERAIELMVNQGFIDPVQGYSMKQGFTESVSSAKLQSLPVEEKSRALQWLSGNGSVSGGFDAANSLVAENEGGFVEVDGASGASAILGINEKWHPEVYASVKALWDSGDVEGAKREARQFYKQEYWDAYGLDKYTPQQQIVLHDAMVNHRSKFREKLLAAADGGASSQELIAMRNAEYRRLGQDERYASSLSGWMNRLTNVSKATGDYYGFMPYASQSAVNQAEQEIEQSIISNMTFASPQERIEMVNQFPEHSKAIASAAKKIDEQVAKDPAGYVMSSPTVMQARQELSQNPTKETQAQYLESIRAEQKRMGVRDANLRYIPEADATELKEMMQTDGISSDAYLQKIDEIKLTHAPVLNRAISDLRNYGVDQGTLVLMQVDNQTVRKHLADAYMLGSKQIESAIPEDAKAGVNLNSEIQSKIDDEWEDLVNAMQAIPGQTQPISEYRGAAELLAKHYMAQGSDINEAVTKATQGLFSDEVYGTLILPKGSNAPLIHSVAENMRAKVMPSDIVAPLGIRGDEARELEYNKQAVALANPIVEGDRVVFVSPDGQKLLDKDLVEYDEYGRVINENEAAISISLAEASEFSGGLQADPESVGNLRAKVAAETGVDYGKYYNHTSTVSGLSYVESAAVIQPSIYSSGQQITPSVYESLGDADKARAKDAIARNVKYNQAVLSKIPEESRADFKKMVEKSRAPIEEIGNLRAEISRLREEIAQETKVGFGGVVAKPSAKLQKKIDAKNKAQQALKDYQVRSDGVIGVGYQFLEMPEWAK